jgi:hypothetical protein
LQEKYDFAQIFLCLLLFLRQLLKVEKHEGLTGQELRSFEAVKERIITA